jgi:hypothetical protein
MSDSEGDTATSAFTTLETHLKLQAGRTTIDESGKQSIRNGGSTSSFNEGSMSRPIPRLSMDSGLDDTSIAPSSSNGVKPVDRKISLTQSIDSSSNSPRSPHATLSSTIDSRSLSIDTEAEENASGRRGSAFKKFFRFGK